MKKNLIFLLLICLIHFLACNSGDGNANSASSELTGNENSSETTTNNEGSDPNSNQAVEDNRVIAWVDKLNIREQPNTKSKVIAQVKENATLILTGEKTDFTETIKLRGNSYTEPWVKVETAKGQQGWVFQGAIKQPGEDKGTVLNSATQFTYPHFGSFDLTNWKKMPSRDDSSEEVDVKTEVYKKGKQGLEISTSEMGEFHYGKTFRLLDENDKVVKERRVAFSAQVDYNKMTETVMDYSSNPPKQYTREKDLNQHFSRLNPKPDMAEGDWKVETIEDHSTGLNDREGFSKQGKLSDFAVRDCDNTKLADEGCSCSFSTGDPYKGPTIFYSDMMPIN